MKKIITILAMLVLSIASTVAMTASDASVILSKVAEAKKSSTYERAAKAVRGQGDLSSFDRSRLRADLPEFDRKNKAVADAIRLVLSGAPVSRSKSTSISSRASVPEPAISPLDALAENTSVPEMKISTIVKNRAESTIRAQIENKGTPYGIQESKTGNPGLKDTDQAMLLASAQAALDVLEGKEASGDRSEMAGVLLSSSTKAQREARDLKGENRKTALKVAGAYQVGAAALEGVMTIIDEAPPQPPLRKKVESSVPLQTNPPAIVSSASAPKKEANPAPAPQEDEKIE